MKEGRWAILGEREGEGEGEGKSRKVGRCEVRGISSELSWEY